MSYNKHADGDHNTDCDIYDLVVLGGGPAGVARETALPDRGALPGQGVDAGGAEELQRRDETHVHLRAGHGVRRVAF